MINEPSPNRKSGTVILMGRPNAGKSTLLNHLVGQKVAITSPKPQTTRFSVQAVYEDERGQIVFADTPGIFAKAHDDLSKSIGRRLEEAMKERVDVVVYVIDHTRYRDVEENKTLGLVRSIDAPKILVVNKIDIREPSYKAQYAFMEDEFNDIVEISALKRLHLNTLIDKIFEHLPEGENLINTTDMVTKSINVDSKLFLSELIREKAFLFLRQELPYSLTAVVDEVTERQNGTLYVRARILTNEERYKGMIVGSRGAMIKEISMATRKELETATNKQVFIDLSVETDPHWVDYL